MKFGYERKILTLIRNIALYLLQLCRYKITCHWQQKLKNDLQDISSSAQKIFLKDHGSEKEKQSEKTVCKGG